MKCFSFFLINLFIILASCKKTSSLNNTQPVYLRDKSLNEIKNEVAGNWKIHYRYGGITGNIKTQMINSFLKVIPNDSIYFTLNNSLIATDSAKFQKTNTNFGYSAFTISFTSIGGTPYSWIIDYKLGDTLVLVDNFPNAEGYYMTRVQ